MLLQCVAVCCSVLQCVAVCCSVLQCVAWLLSIDVMFLHHHRATSIMWARGSVTKLPRAIWVGVPCAIGGSTLMTHGSFGAVCSAAAHPTHIHWIGTFHSVVIDNTYHDSSVLQFVAVSATCDTFAILDDMGKRKWTMDTTHTLCCSVLQYDAVSFHVRLVSSSGWQANTKMVPRLLRVAVGCNVLQCVFKCETWYLL